MIDKLHLNTQDFEVKNYSDWLTVQQAPILPGGEQRNEEILPGLQAQKAYYNEEHLSLNINKHGAQIVLNPSKRYHSWQLVESMQQVEEHCREVQQRLSKLGMSFSLEEALINRLDITKQKTMKFPIGYYTPLFQVLKAKRVNAPVLYPGGFQQGNRSTQMVFYDKKEELSTQRIEYPGNNLLRGEVKFLKRSSVGSFMKFDKLKYLLQADMNYLNGIYNSTLADRLFRVQDISTQMIINYNSELELLKAIRSNKKRGAVSEYILVTGINEVLQRFGSIDNFRVLLEEAGYSRATIWREISKLERRLQQRAFISSREPNYIGSMYQEVLSKFVA